VINRLRDAVSILPPNLVRAAIVIAVLPMVGTAGYILIEGWSFSDALYMTIMTVTTIGFREVQPLDEEGRVFTMVLAVTGVGAIFYALVGIFQFLLEGELAAILGVRRMKGRIESLRNHYILCGYGRVGSEVAQEFRHRGVPFVIVESNPNAIEQAEMAGCLVVHGDATTDSALKDAGIEHARGLLAASDSDSGNTFIVLTAKAMRPDLYVVSRAGRGDSESRMHRAGADRVFSPYIIAGRQMALSALQPMVIEFIDTLSGGQAGDKVLAEIDVSEASGLAGHTVHDVLHTCPSVVVLAVQRAGGELSVGAPSNTVLAEGDRVIVMGQEEELEAIKPSRNLRSRQGVSP
jgi:voltage-gated potassium channel